MDVSNQELLAKWAKRVYNKIVYAIKFWYDRDIHKFEESCMMQCTEYVQVAEEYFKDILTPRLASRPTAAAFDIVFGIASDEATVLRLFEVIVETDNDREIVYEYTPELVDEVQRILNIETKFDRNALADVRKIVKPKGTGRGSAFGVRDLDTGKIWNNQDECVNDIKPGGVSHVSAYKNLNAHLNGRTKTCYGHKCERVTNQELEEIIAKKEAIKNSRKF